MKTDPLIVSLGEACDCLRARVTVFLRPIAEPVGAPPLEVSGQGLEQGVRVEILAPLGAEPREDR